MESVAVADVPDAPLSTIGGAGIIPLGEPLTAQFTLTLLLLQHLEGDGSQFGIRSEDAVSVKGGFVHGHKLDQMRAEVNRGRTVPQPNTTSAMAVTPSTHSQRVICSVAGTARSMSCFRCIATAYSWSSP